MLITSTRRFCAKNSGDINIDFFLAYLGTQKIPFILYQNDTFKFLSAMKFQDLFFNNYFKSWDQRKYAFNSDICMYISKLFFSDLNFFYTKLIISRSRIRKENRKTLWIEAKIPPFV